MFILLSVFTAGHTELDVEALIDAHSGAVKRCAYLCLRDEALYQAVMDLPLKYREPIILHYYFDVSQRDTARILAIGDSTLRTRLLRARLLLRKALGEEVEL